MAWCAKLLWTGGGGPAFYRFDGLLLCEAERCDSTVDASRPILLTSITMFGERPAGDSAREMEGLSHWEIWSLND